MGCDGPCGTQAPFAKETESATDSSVIHNRHVAMVRNMFEHSHSLPNFSFSVRQLC